jgi:hypothetical protein
VARLRSSHSYASVLALIIGTFVFTAAAPDTRWAQGVLIILECVVLITALWTSGLGEDFLPGVVVAGISAALAVGLFFTGGDVLVGTGWIVQVVLAVGTAAVIALGVIDQNTINAQSIQGAVGIYWLLGLLFTFAYGAAAVLGSGHFFAQGTDGTTAIRLYFSYVTLATLGYGDYTPATSFGHILAVLEALLGQIYLVTVVAVLVSRLGRTRTA